jgi:hypothetical protein
MNWKVMVAMFLLLANVSALAANVREASPEAGVAAEDIPQTVTVHGERDPAIAPYADAYRMLNTVREASGGKVDLLIRLLSATSLQPIPDLELSLRGETISEKLTLSPDGFLDLPLDNRYLDDKAEILTNKKKGSVRVEFYFVPKLPQEGITYGDMALDRCSQTGGQGNSALVPAPARLVHRRSAPVLPRRRARDRPVQRRTSDAGGVERAEKHAHKGNRLLRSLRRARSRIGVRHTSDGAAGLGGAVRLTRCRLIKSSGTRYDFFE